MFRPYGGGIIHRGNKGERTFLPANKQEMAEIHFHPDLGLRIFNCLYGTYPLF